MKYLVIFILIAIPKVTFAQSEIDSNKVFLLESNLPDELSSYYVNVMKKNYSLRSDLNPFYLRGDFDGDKVLDYAISIVDNATGKKGILVYHCGTKIEYVIGCGALIPNGNGGDDYSWMDAWNIFSGEYVEGGVGETEKIILKGESIVVIKTESASALIYWNGKEYLWYQLGD